MSKAELIFGTPNAYQFLADTFGDMFTTIHGRKSFLTRAERSVPPFTGGDIPFLYKSGENTRSRKVYRKRDLIEWFISGFSDAATIKRARQAAGLVDTTR